MRILITGACGFVGSSIARELRQQHAFEAKLFGIDNLSRRGSEINRAVLKGLGVDLIHGDLRSASDMESIPPVDWVIDAAANPSVLAGVSGAGTSRQLMEHNLFGSVNVLEYCKTHGAGLVLLSTSRVYSIDALSRLPMHNRNGAFEPDFERIQITGFSTSGIGESFPSDAPISLYGATKLASEQLALEYGSAYGFPVWINRCGVLAGAGQFGRADQGIFSYWIHSWVRRDPLRYFGFGGNGHQVRDALHPRDLTVLLIDQLRGGGPAIPRTLNLGGGIANAMSLAQLSAWCRERFGPNDVVADGSERPFDIPWLVMDTSRATHAWDWRPQVGLEAILEEIAQHATSNPGWIDIAG